MNLLLVILMYATWSSVFAFGKIALEHSPPIFLTGVRMLFASVLLIGYILIRRKTNFRFQKKQWLLLGILSLTSIYLTNVFEFWSLKQLTAAKACFIYSLSPFFAALFSYIHFKEKMNRNKWIGMGLGFLGFIPLLASQKGASELVSTVPFLSWPEITMVGASLATAYGWIVLRMLVNPSAADEKAPEISPMVANGLSMFIGGALALLHSLFIDSWAPIPVAKEHIGTVAQMLVIMTLISNVVCYNLYGYLLKKFTATFLSFMGLLSPIFASLSSWFFLGERPSVVIFGSMALVSYGLWMVYSAELRQGYIQKGSSEAKA